MSYSGRKTLQEPYRSKDTSQVRIVRRRDMFSFRLSRRTPLSLQLVRVRLLLWSWPIVIIASAIAANMLVFYASQSAVRPILVLWFLLICPGMAFVRLLRISSPAIEITLAIALSLALGTVMAGALIYAGVWSTSVTLAILGGLSVFGSLVQLVFPRSDEPRNEGAV